jgi:hypothetical protein
MKNKVGILLFIVLIINSSNSLVKKQQSGVLENPLLFALVPPPINNNTFGHQMETFGNHRTEMTSAIRGGDLCLMDVQGNVRFLTKEAGFGVESGEIQTEKAIAVRQPCVHWSGKKALFSMIIGGPIKAYDISYLVNRWQIYEITNLDDVITGAIPIIVKVPYQSNYNNISPIYGSDDQIIYTSDAPLFGMEHTYPQRDEYESSTINTGIFKLNPTTGAIVHLTHSPSGDFDVHLASDGRIISTRWEHLKRDQQADADRFSGTPWDPINYESESKNASIIKGPAMKNGLPYADAGGTPWEVFPEARVKEDPTRNPNEPLHDFNEFLPWEITENGERHQTMNHVGRHEFGGVYQEGSKMDDPNLIYTLGNFSKNPIRETVGSDAGIFQIKEDPRPGKQGTFYGTWSKEFSRFASGRILEFSLPIGANPQDMVIVDWTNPVIDVVANTKGHFRNPIMLKSGTMIVSHAAENGVYSKDNLYHFQISAMQKLNVGANDTEHVAGPPFTKSGYDRKIIYWGDYITPVSIDVKMNEVDVVEVTPRNRPSARPKYEISAIEKEVLDEEGIDEQSLRNWMKERNLALIVIRNITERDQGETQQPFNLQVPGGVSTIPKAGKVYDISHFQLFSAELLRTYGLRSYEGRRVLATPLRNSEQNPDIEGFNLIDHSGPEASVKISSDGSVAAFVPATRAMTWQTVAPDGEPIVRERQWLTFASGEIRTCEGCHGINSKTMAGNLVPKNKPEALRKLMVEWKNDFGGLVTATEKEEIIKYSEKLDGVALFQNFPNPFISSTTIVYQIGKSSHVSIKIFNILGQEILPLENAQKAIGTHKIEWNGMNLHHEKVEKGTYFCCLNVDGKTYYNKIIRQ